jgi:hypothetical protein
MVIGKKKKEAALSVIILNKISLKEMGRCSLSLGGKVFDSENVDSDDFEGKDADIFVDVYLSSLCFNTKRLIVFRMTIISITILNTNMI